MRLFLPVLLHCLLMLATNSFGANYIGSQQCAGCHRQAFEDWQGSHHDWAMKPATPETVLGNFNNASLNHHGVISTFTRKNGQYVVNTQGADGEYRDFTVDYTFGVEPLQQYLISFPDGRMQAMTLAWDSRPKGQGGQRWYQLMPDDLGEPGDSLHWTGAYYNWNSRCADCHSTGLEKNYSMATDTYDTDWSEVNVACEACHGPGADHAQWAKSFAKGTDNGLSVQYSKPLNWVIAEGANFANPVGDPHDSATTEIESCAGCHSLRAKITDDPINKHQTDKRFLDHYQLQTLEHGLYHADGQIQDEVYVYGSFVQSKMHQRGVACSNCHNPHSLELKAEGNELCAGCHASQTYNTPSHHFHQDTDSTGAQCVNCHMPATVYMGVDARRDHSMRVPRPDITAKIGAPNACNVCHTDKTVDWSVSAIQGWLKGKTREPEPAAGSIYAARTNQPNANQQLIELANNPSINTMARSTALGLLASYPNRLSYDAARQQLSHKDALVRMGALQALALLPLEQRWQDISPLLDDPVRSVRLQATRLLIGIKGISPAQQELINRRAKSYIKALRVSADMPNGQLNLATAYIALGQVKNAEKAYRHALQLDSKSIAARLNLADLYRAQGQEQKAILQLQQAQAISPNDATVLHSLGLAQIRSKQNAQALLSLKRASKLAPNNSRYSYVYGLALNGQGRGIEAVEVMADALSRDKRNRDLLIALTTINRDLGRLKNARGFAEQLVLAFPEDSG
ncbi:MAG: tetratricopeptide repeat protein, partial [Porticoccaceae bacterium]|nr:tetratricopeptide repeat protein [Porticoccaceae bacterium]